MISPVKEVRNSNKIKEGYVKFPGLSLWSSSAPALFQTSPVAVALILNSLLQAVEKTFNHAHAQKRHHAAGGWQVAGRSTAICWTSKFRLQPCLRVALVI